MEESPRKRRKLDIECLFSDLKSRFLEIDIKINSKKELVNVKYETDVEKIEHIFDENKMCPVHIEGINNGRDHLLNKLWQNRNDHLEEVNKLFENFAENLALVKTFNTDQYDIGVEMTKEVLIGKYDKIKENFFHFAKLRRKNYAPMLSKYEFKKPFDLVKLNKYFHLAAARKSSISVPDDYDIIGIHHILPLKRVLLYARRSEFTQSKELLIVDEDGVILNNSCKIANEGGFDSISVKVSSSAIVVFFNYVNELNINLDMYQKPFVQVYDFELNLIKSFELSFYYFNEFISPNNQAVFQNYESKRILVYDLDYFKTIYINTQCKTKQAFYVQFNDSLIYLNELFLYFVRGNKDGTFANMYIMSRNYGVCVSRVDLSPRAARNSIMFDTDSNIYDLDRSRNAISVYNSHGTPLYGISFRGNIRLDKFSIYDTIIFNNKFRREHHEDDDDDSDSDSDSDDSEDSDGEGHEGDPEIRYFEY